MDEPTSPATTPKPRRLLWGALALAVALEVAVLVSGQRVLVWQQRPTDNAPVSMPDYGRLDSSSIVCHYFNGRGFVFRVYWYSPNNFMGRDSCPFLIGDDD